MASIPPWLSDPQSGDLLDIEHFGSVQVTNGRELPSFTRTFQINMACWRYNRESEYILQFKDRYQQLM
jgi:hypothetical protein